jgi:hypothetical protein
VSLLWGLMRFDSRDMSSKALADEGFLMAAGVI